MLQRMTPEYLMRLHELAQALDMPLEGATGLNLAPSREDPRVWMFGVLYNSEGATQYRTWRITNEGQPITDPFLVLDRLLDPLTPTRTHSSA